MLPHIRCHKSLLDIGCGMGLIDFHLSPHIESITCVDNQPEAIAGLHQAAQKRNIDNITALTADAYAITGAWDTVICLFFGHIAKSISHLLSLCNDTVIAIVHLDAHGEQKGTTAKCNTVEAEVAALDALSIRYQLHEYALEYGQPFRDIADACAFASAYKKIPEGESAAEYMQSRLIHTEDAEYPLYMPHTKRFGMFVIKKEENPHA